MPNAAKRIEPEYFGVDEAEILTGRSRWSWRKDAYSGRIASVKIGRRLLIPKREIDRVMSEGYRPALGGESSTIVTTSSPGNGAGAPKPLQVAQKRSVARRRA
jgi:hypothetical protein